MKTRSRFAIMALALASVVTACSETSNPTSTSGLRPAFSGGTGGGGGGTGGGGTVACSNIKSFKAVPGYYPGSKTWGAIWQSVTIAPCDSGATVRGLLSATQTSAAGPYRSLLGPSYVGPVALVEFYASGKSGSGVTWDWEPVELASQYNIKLDVFDMNGVLLESKTLSVSTPTP